MEPPQDQVPGLAGRWRRLFAGIIDWVLVGILEWPFVAKSEFFERLSERAQGRTMVVDATIGWGWGLLALLVAFLYYWLLHGYWNGQTVGKKLLGIGVVQQNGAAITPGQAAGRAAFFPVLGSLCCGLITLVDLLFILFDSRKQALHDKVAKTLVVSNQ